MSYTVRPFRESDAEALHALTLAAIREIGRAGYSQEQVDVWASRHSAANRLIERAEAGHKIFVAVDGDDQPAAFSLIEPDGHLDQLYGHPDHTRRGLAEKVLNAAEDYARSQGVKRLYTEASELARPAFERCGYAVTHRRDFEIEHGGKAVAIHNYAMEKLLD